MSVIGISPTDIVKAAKALKDAATALTSGPEGARQQFQDAQAALSSLEQALADLEESKSSGHPPDVIYNALLESERRFQVSLQPYNRQLGPKSQSKPFSTIKRKLQYAFDGDAKVQKHIIASKPGVDAALFHTMRDQNDLATKHQTEITEAMRDGFVAIAERFDAVAPDIANRLCRTIETLPQEHSQVVKTTMSAHWEDAKLDLSQLIKQAVQAGIVDSVRRDMSSSPTDGNSHNERNMNPNRSLVTQDSYQRRYATLKMGPEAWNVGQAQRRRISPSTSRLIRRPAGQTFRDDRYTVATKLLYCLLSISSAALYQNPATRKILANCLSGYHRDPISVTLLLISILAFTNCFMSLPAQISLLSDNSILLDTALGEPLKLPRHYWESFDIFHGFLLTHFAAKPGQGYVRKKRYRILLGGATGQVLDVGKWDMVVAARMKLVMALLLEGTSESCPKCSTILTRRTYLLSHCTTCDTLYQSIDTENESRFYGIEESDSSHDFLDSAEPSLDVALNGAAQRNSLHKGNTGFSGRSDIGTHPEELQYFVHMLLTKGMHETNPQYRPAYFSPYNPVKKDLKLVSEALEARVEDWKSFEFEHFGSLLLHDRIEVGRPGKRGEILTCHLFEGIMIMVKERYGPNYPAVRVRGHEFDRCSLKGSVLFQKHLVSLSQRTDDEENGFCLTLHLSVAELPAIEFYFQDLRERMRWFETIGRLRFGWRESIESELVSV